MKTVIIEDEKAAVRNLTSLLYEVKPEAENMRLFGNLPKAKMYQKYTALLEMAELRI